MFQMKRRGFVPNGSTYATLLKGYSQITEEQWPQYTQQLENVHKAFEGFMAFADTVKHKNPTPTELNNTATTHYFIILGRAGLHQRLFEVFEEQGWRHPPYKEPLPLERAQPARFKRLCFRALAENAVSEAKAAELLGISVRQLNLEMDQPPFIQAA